MMILIKPVEYTYATTIHRIGASTPCYKGGRYYTTTSALMGVKVAELFCDIIIDILNYHNTQLVLQISMTGVIYYWVRSSP